MLVQHAAKNTIATRSYGRFRMTSGIPSEDSTGHDEADEKGVTGWWFGTCFISPFSWNEGIKIDKLICFTGVGIKNQPGKIAVLR